MCDKGITIRYQLYCINCMKTNKKSSDTFICFLHMNFSLLFSVIVEY